MPTYRYDATTSDGRPVAGTIDAATPEAGRAQLQSLALGVRLFEPVAPARIAALSGTDLLTFNEQLAHLARAGLPVESGLRLLAQDLARGRLRTAVTAVVDALNAGATLPQAIQSHRRAFPPLYANLVDAGIRTGNLPGVLFNLGTHLDLTTRIRAALSRALAYPTMLLLALVLVSAYLSAYVLPPMVAMFSNQNDGLSYWLAPRRGYGAPAVPRTPWVTTAALGFGQIAPYVAGAVVVLVIATVLLWPLVRGTRGGRAIVDSLLTRLPLFGPPLRFSLIGRWCDAARIGVEAGLDLPAALSLASDAVGSKRLHADSSRLIEAVTRGGSLASASPLAILPAAVPASIDQATASNNLVDTLRSLAAMYLRQAEARARLIPLTLTPIFVFVIAVVVGGLLTAMFIPIIRLLNAAMGVMI